jgi:hypothetical protein
MIPDWMKSKPVAEVKQKTHVKIDTLAKFDTIVKKFATSDADREAAAIEKADSYSFQVANPWLLQTDANVKIVNKWLENKGIRYATYPEITEAVEELAQAGLVSVDDAAYASHLDGIDNKKFVGALTKCEYTDLDTMLKQERHAAIQRLGTEKESPEEEAFNAIPLEDQKKMLRDAQRIHQANADAAVSKDAADSWVSMSPTYRDDDRNAKLLLLEMSRTRQGTSAQGPFSIAEHEAANKKLVDAGLIRQNPIAVKKQEAQAVLARAEAAKNEPGSPWDTTSEEEMENLPLDELRKRADKQLASRR